MTTCGQELCAIWTGDGCACGGGDDGPWFCGCFYCSRLATHTQDSPYMDSYCDGCTLNRCDVNGHPVSGVSQ